MYRSIGKPKLFFCLSTLLLILISCCAKSQTLYVKHYSTKNDLPSNILYMCHQDLDGYIWIGAAGGIIRFDGKNFQKYSYKKDSLVKGPITVITNDSHNQIWVKSWVFSPFFSVIKKNTVTKYQDSVLLSNSFEDSKLEKQYYSKANSTAYIIGEERLVRIGQEGIPHFEHIGMSRHASIFETNDNRVFAADKNHLFDIAASTPFLIKQFDFIDNNTKFACHNNTLYCATKNIIHVYKYNGVGFDSIETHILRYKIRNMHANKYGLWLSPYSDKSVHLYRNFQLKSAPLKVEMPGIPDYYMTDNEGGVWIVIVNNGIAYIPNPSIVNYTVKDGLSSSEVFVFKKRDENSFWAGYYSGEIDVLRFSDEKINAKKILQIDDDLHGYSFMIDIKRYKNKTYFLSRGKLVELTNGKLITHPNIGSTYKSFEILNDTLLSIGSTSYIIYNLKTKKRKLFDIGRIYKQTIDTNGVLWLGGLTGLYSFNVHKDTAPRLFELHEKNNIVNSMTVYKDYLWVMCLDGLYLLKGRSIIRHYTKEDIPIQSLDAFSISTNRDQVWIGNSKGVFIGWYDYDALTFKKTLQLDYNDGLLGQNISTITFEDTVVYVSTNSSGFAKIYNIEDTKLNYQVSDIRFKRIGANEYLNPDSVNIEYSKKGLEVEFYAAALKYHDEISYRYKLNGFDDDWRVTNNNIVHYTNIPPGKYEFLIDIVDNRPNTESITKKTIINISPLYWQTVWFKILAGVFVVALIGWGFNRYYNYRKKQALKKLNQKALLAKTRMETFKAQIKPHFIFNSLNALQDYVYTNNSDDVAKILREFATLFRKGLHLADSDFTSIEEEVSFLIRYLELEKVKSEGKFDYAIHIEQGLEQNDIPSLLTQPFVENAVIHGASTAKGKGHIKINYYSEGNNIICKIADNGIGIKKSGKNREGHVSKGTAMSLMRISEYKSGLGLDVELHIEDISDIDSDTNGTVVTIVIKDIKKQAKHEDDNN